MTSTKDIARTDAAIEIFIFLTAFAVRLLYLYQIQAIPLFYHLGGDPQAYDLWARKIVAGDWLGDRVFYQAPLYPNFLALLQSIFGYDLWSIRVAEIAFGA